MPSLKTPRPKVVKAGVSRPQKLSIFNSNNQIEQAKKNFERLQKMKQERRSLSESSVDSSSSSDSESSSETSQGPNVTQIKQKKSQNSPQNSMMFSRSFLPEQTHKGSFTNKRFFNNI